MAVGKPSCINAWLKQQPVVVCADVDVDLEQGAQCGQITAIVDSASGSATLFRSRKHPHARA